MKKTSPDGKKVSAFMGFTKKKKAHTVHWRTCKVTLKWICKIFYNHRA